MACCLFQIAYHYTIWEKNIRIEEEKCYFKTKTRPGWGKSKQNPQFLDDGQFPDETLKPKRMKRTLLLSLFIMSGLSSFPQKFIVEAAGLVNADDTSKHYLVIRIDSLSVVELYNRSVRYVEQNWKDPEMQKEEKGGEWLLVKIHAKNAIVAKGSFGLKFNLDLNYRLRLDFKDGKVKYQILDLEMNNISPYGEDAPFLIQSNTTLTRSIYNKEGVLIEKEKAAKKQLEDYFNNQIMQLKLSLMVTSSKTDF